MSDIRTAETILLDEIKDHMLSLDPIKRKRFNDKLTELIDSYKGIPF